jgi:hypothetical protein
VREEIGGLRAELGEEIGGVRGELGEEIGGLRAKLGEEIGGVRSELGDVRKEINGVQRTIAYGAIAMTGAILAGLAGICTLIAATL